MLSEDRAGALQKLPPLMQQFLRKRRAGLSVVRENMERLGLDMPTFFTLMLLRVVEGSYGGAVTLTQIRRVSTFIYSAKDNVSERLETLKEKGLIIEDSAEGYALTPWASGIVAGVHEAGWAHLSSMQPLPAVELEKLTEELERAVSHMMNDSLLTPLLGTHLAGSRSLAVFGSDAHPMVRLEQAIYDLWLARDDAHIGAWRDAELGGPTMQVLSLLWAGNSRTVSGLAEALEAEQSPEDLEVSLTTLMERGYMSREGDDVSLTPEGALAREDIERETNRRYFSSWPHTTEEAEWIGRKLGELIENIPAPFSGR